ncbi:DUF1697 domain-containing protein [Streptomyces sp. NPDC056835]|uniref:DUF1697 domain-containing protein n=1 Tax=Streptomyces sp. NPDC056835 TaxID=3345956 RepID=UPI0036CCF635
MQYVMFLRGINVGGIRVPMGELRVCLAQLGLTDIKTYLQTGNVTFSSSLPAAEIKSSVEKTLGEEFHYEAFILLFPAAIIEKVITQYPFAADDQTHRYAIFCGSQDIINELAAYSSELIDTVEAIAPGENVLYWRAPKGSSTDTFFSKILSKSKYKATTTNRNLNTLEKMI